MALAIDYVFKELPVPDAYLSVSGLLVTDDKLNVSFSLMYRAHQGAEALTASRYTAPYSLEGDNPFIQAYTYLKQLPEFRGCTDC